MRNISAGILLLYKEKLRSLSPDDSSEVLIKQKIKPERIGNEVKFIGFGKKTVNIRQIQERFESLNIIVDWKRLKKINDIRNDIEHYCTTESEARVREVISYSFTLIRDFTKKYLHYEPVKLFGQETWSVFLDVSDVYKKEVAECNIENEKIKWENESLKEAYSEEVRCPECHSNLIRPTNPEKHDVTSLELFCSSCGHYFLLEEVIDEILYEYFYPEFYLSMTDGNDIPLGDCPECGKGTYIIGEDTCAYCGYSREYTQCAVCHCSIGIEEQEFNGLCSYHYNLAMKDD